MPIDPDISLRAGVPAAGQAQANPVVNPLGLISSYADIAGKMNQLKLFNQTFQARQRASELIAAAPDLETGLNSVLHDPVASFGAGETINQFRQAGLAVTQQKGEIQKQAQTGLEAALQGLNGALQDPANFKPITQAYRATLSPQAQPAFDSAIDSIQKGLIANSPDQPTYQKNLAALIMGAHVSPDTVRATLGTLPPTVQVGPYGTGGATTPVILGGPAAGGAGAVLASPGTSSTGPGPGPGPGPGSAPSSASAPASPLPSGPTQAQTQFQEGMGHQMADYVTGLNDRTQTGSTIMQTIQEGREALQSMRAGGGASVYARAAQVAQALGAPNPVVDKISNGGLDASQEFTKLMVNTTMGQIQNQIPAGSKLNQQEFKVFSANNPNIDTDPRAIDKIFNFWTRIHNRDFAEQQALADAMKAPGFDVTTWPARWQKQMRDQGIVKVSTPAAGSQTQVPGGATHRWIPGQGIVPIGSGGSSVQSPPLAPAGTLEGPDLR